MPYGQNFNYPPHRPYPPYRPNTLPNMAFQHGFPTTSTGDVLTQPQHQTPEPTILDGTMHHGHYNFQTPPKTSVGSETMADCS